jgi:hypothetical protein
MKPNQFSDRNLKIGIVLAVAVIGWFLLEKAERHSQTAINSSAGQAQIVKALKMTQGEPES